ncbi:MAG: hypothetical protein K9G67_02935 [Bacteroidales bacterium]|nr:hypothetical protein [Bacteroidales bacterium]MCF8344456.1 hypothetical protein [Bacteroidales bacterium]MCF8375284.1 hypothetical protein [Bacteroidales bacterium]MCF8400140.1 hypothetical protein [Bacteroidales bacterium]
MIKNRKHKNVNKIPDGKRNPFVTPAGYFEKLPASISEKILKGENRQPGKIKAVYRIMLAAASVAILLLLGFLFMKNKSIQNTDIFAELSDREIIAEKTDLLSYLSEDDLIKLLVMKSDSPDDLRLLKEENYLILNDEQITDEVIIDYILTDDLNQNIYF